MCSKGLLLLFPSKCRKFSLKVKQKQSSVQQKLVDATENVFSEAFSAFLEENPDEGKAIIAKVLLALRARKAAKAAKDSILRKGVLEGMTLPGKLADCQSRKAEESELFIVEGDSAGGTAKAGRDRRIQAILPLRGKILNVERARLDRMLGLIRLSLLFLLSVLQSERHLILKNFAITKLLLQLMLTLTVHIFEL